MSLWSSDPVVWPISFSHVIEYGFSYFILEFATPFLHSGTKLPWQIMDVFVSLVFTFPKEVLLVVYSMHFLHLAWKKPFIEAPTLHLHSLASLIGNKDKVVMFEVRFFDSFAIIAIAAEAAIAFLSTDSTVLVWCKHRLVVWCVRSRSGQLNSHCSTWKFWLYFEARYR